MLVDLEFKGEIKVAKGFPGNENATVFRIAILSACKDAVLSLSFCRSNGLPLTEVIAGEE